MTYHYLASPYSSDNPDTRERRLDAAFDALAFLIKHKFWAYSPIVHCHEIAIRNGLPSSYHFWQQYNHAMMLSSKSLFVLTIDGWDESLGVADEIAFARRINLTTKFLHPLNNTYVIKKVE